MLVTDEGEDYPYLVSQVEATFSENQADELLSYLETLPGTTAWKKPAYKPIKGHAGPGAMAKYFLGKKVACTGWGVGGGVWSEYVVKSVKGGVLALNKSLSLEQGAMSIINPITASAFIDIAKKGGHKAILLTAAASSLGKMVNNLGRSEGIQIINIVRRDQQVDLLKAKSADIVLNSNEAGFEQQTAALTVSFAKRKSVKCQSYSPSAKFHALMTRRD